MKMFLRSLMVVNLRGGNIEFLDFCPWSFYREWVFYVRRSLLDFSVISIDFGHNLKRNCQMCFLIALFFSPNSLSKTFICEKQRKKELVIIPVHGQHHEVTDHDSKTQLGGVRTLLDGTRARSGRT